MNNGYKNQCFIKRMLNNLFRITKTIEAPLEYTQKEVMENSNRILDFLNNRVHF